MNKKEIFAVIICLVLSCTAIINVASQEHNTEKIDIQQTAPAIPIEYKILTLNNVLIEICKNNIKEPLIVLKQCIIETKWLQCTNCCLDVNNLFGFGWNGKTYYKYNHWTESVKAYKHFQAKTLKVNEDYYEYLVRIKYAEDPNYINKLKNIKL
jgi:hypothetical protein